MALVRARVELPTEGSPAGRSAMLQRLVGKVHQALFEEYGERLQRLNYARETQSNYLGATARFLRFFSSARLSAMTPEHIERYLSSRSLTPASTRTELECLRTFFVWLVKQKGVLTKNPCDHVERPRLKERWRPAPTFAEFQAIRQACLTLRETVLVELFYFSGLRLNELRRLQWRDIDLVQRRIQVLGKGGKERITVFPERVAVLLRAWRQQMLGGWVFPATANTNPQHRWVKRTMGETRLERTLHRLGRDAHLPYHLTAHILRHGWVRLMKVQGMPVEVTARLAGHSSIQTTVKLYGRLDENDLQTIYDRHIGTIGQSAGFFRSVDQEVTHGQRATQPAT